MKHLLICTALACATVGAVAQKYSEEETEAAFAQCKFPTGEPIQPPERCRQVQATWASVKANAEKQKARAEEARAAEAKAREREAAEEADRIQKKKDLDEYWAIRHREEEAARAKEQAEADARYAEIDRAAANRQKACGKDYDTPRIGMPISRAEQCITDLMLVAQVNRRDGVLSRYEGAGLYVMGMGGRVVGWGNL